MWKPHQMECYATIDCCGGTYLHDTMEDAVLYARTHDGCHVYTAAFEPTYDVPSVNQRLRNRLALAVVAN